MTERRGFDCHRHAASERARPRANSRFRTLTAAALAAIGLWSGGMSAPAQAQSNSFTVQLVNGDTAVVTVNGTAPEETLSIVATGPQPFSDNLTITISNNSVLYVGNETFDDSVVPINCAINLTTFAVSGQCGFFVPVSGQGAGQAASVGAAHATTRSQVESSIEILSSRIISISRDIAAAQGGEDQDKDKDKDSFRPYTGLAAGSSDMKWGVWFDGSGSYLKNDSLSAAYEGASTTELGGIDYVHNDSWLFGFDAGYARTDVRIRLLNGNRLANAVQAGPYLSYIISQHYAIDALASYAHVYNDFDSATPGGGHGSFQSDRATFAINADIFEQAGKFSVTWYFGYDYAYETPTSASAPNAVGGVPTTIHYGAVKVGSETAYPLGNFEPYVPLSLSYETTETHDGTGRTGLTFGLGTRYQFTDRLKGGAEFTTELRAHAESIIGTINLRYVF